MPFARLSLLALLAVASLCQAAELKLTGEAREHKFVTVDSDKAGQWLVLGPNAAVVLDTTRIANTPVLGSPRINRADSLTMDGGKAVKFVGPPGFYAVTQWGIPGEAEPSILVVEVLAGGPAPPVVPPGPVVPTPPVPTVATAVTYIYEKDQTGSVPAPVLSALNKINLEKKITANPFEQNTTDVGTGQTPTQYKVALAAARAAGLPALVITAGGVVIRVVKDPRTEAAVLEALAL